MKTTRGPGLGCGCVFALTLLACGGKVTENLTDADATSSAGSGSGAGGTGASNTDGATATNGGGAVGGAGPTTTANAATASVAVTNAVSSTTGSVLPPDWTNGIPPLHTEGRHFKDPFGNVVILRGVALADLKEVNTERAGMSVEKLLELLTDADAGFYARVVRFTVFPERWLVDPELYLAEHLRPAVDAAAQRGLYVIVDWHEISDVDQVHDRTTQFWSTVAPVFADYSNVLYELFNEPMNQDDRSWQRWKEQAQPWVNLIRQHAPSNIVLIGGPIWSQQIGGAATDPFEGENLAYVGHIYPIIDRNTWSDTGVMAQVAAVRPLMITEWGFRDDGGYVWDGDKTSFGEPLKAFVEGHGLSWTAWCADNLWAPVMFDENWQLLTGAGEMGGFTRKWLADKKDLDQPQR